MPPRLVGPNSARHQKERESGERDAARLVHQRVNLLFVGKCRAQLLRVEAEDDDEERAREGSYERCEFDGVSIEAQEQFVLTLADELGSLALDCLRVNRRDLR